MQQSVNSIESQSVFDIAIQKYGTVEAAIDIAVANDISVTDALTPGTKLLLPDTAPVNADVLKYYETNVIKPATGSLSADMEDIAILSEIADVDDDGIRYGREYTTEFTNELGSTI